MLAGESRLVRGGKEGEQRLFRAQGGLQYLAERPSGVKCLETIHSRAGGSGGNDVQTGKCWDLGICVRGPSSTVSSRMLTCGFEAVRQNAINGLNTS